MMEDIAILTGGKAIFEDLGIKLENLQMPRLSSIGLLPATAPPPPRFSRSPSTVKD